MVGRLNGLTWGSEAPESMVLVVVLDSWVVSTLRVVLLVDRWSNMRQPMATQHVKFEDEDDWVCSGALPTDERELVPTVRLPISARRGRGFSPFG